MRQAKQEVSKIKAAAEWSSAGEGEAAATILYGTNVVVYPPEISAKTKIVIAVPPDHAVCPRERLVVAQRCAGVASTLKIREGEDRYTVVKRILRCPCNTRLTGNIQIVLIQVAQLRVTAVVIEMQVVGKPVSADNPTRARIDPGGIGVTQ